MTTDESWTAGGVVCPPIRTRRFWAVVLTTAGVFTAISVHDLFRDPAIEMTTRELLVMLLMELLMAACWVPILRRSGWRLSAITAPPVGLDLLRGLALFVGATVLYVTVWIFVGSLAPRFVQAAADVTFEGSLAWWSVLLLLLINPAAEEFLYLGFVANVLRSRSWSLAFWASVVVRVAVHLYQGPLALLAIAPIALLFSWYYLGSRRIWPTIIAHAIMDFVGLRDLIAH